MLYKVFKMRHIPFLPSHYNGITIGFFIFVKNTAADYVVRHELIHVKQFWHNPLMPLMYLVSKRRRYQYEVEAYRESIKYGCSPTSCASSLANAYGLDITREHALIDLGESTT